MPLEKIKLDELEIDSSVNIIGTDADPILPGTAGRVAFARDNNILYFAEDDATWIQFLPQEASAGDPGAPSEPEGGGGGGAGSSVTGAGFLNGYYILDAERKEIGIYYSGTASDPLEPKVFVYDTSETYESVLLENVLSAPAPLTLGTDTINYPDIYLDMEHLTGPQVKQAQTITLDSIKAGSLSVTVRVGLGADGADSLVTVTVVDDDDTANAATLTTALTNLAIANTTFSSDAAVVSVSAPVGFVKLLGKSSSGGGEVTYAETEEGFEPIGTQDSLGSLKPFKKFKDKVGSEWYIGTVGLTYSNNRKFPGHDVEAWDLDKGTKIPEPRYSEVTGKYGADNGPGYYSVKHKSYDQAEWMATGSENRNLFTQRLEKCKINKDGGVYSLTGLQSTWTGLKSMVDVKDGAEVSDLNDIRFGTLYSQLNQVSDFNDPLGRHNIGKLEKSNLYYTDELGRPGRVGVSLDDGECYYSHWVGELDQTHKIHGHRAKGSACSNFASAFAFNAAGGMLPIGYQQALGNGALKTSFGMAGLLSENIALLSTNDDNNERIYHHPGGAFYSSEVTGYFNQNGDGTNVGHVYDSLWGGMAASEQYGFDDEGSSVGGYHHDNGLWVSGIGRRRTFKHVLNTGAKDTPGINGGAYFGSNEQPVPIDKGDNEYTFSLGHTYVTGFIPKTIAGTARDYKYEAQFYNLRDGDTSSSTANNGRDWGNPNNAYNNRLYATKVIRSIATPFDGGKNYIHKSDQWPYNVLTCKDGSFGIPWRETLAMVKNKSGGNYDPKLSWGPDDDFTREVVYKSEPYQISYDNRWTKAAGSAYTSAYAGGFTDRYLNDATTLMGEESSSSMATIISNSTNISHHLFESQATLFALGTAYGFNRWLMLCIFCGRLCLVNYRTFAQYKAGEYPNAPPWLAGETVLENNKFYHFAAVKNSAKNSICLYVNGEIDAKATLIADVSAHGSAYNGGTYYDDGAGNENLPVYGVTVPQYVSEPEIGFGNYSWMGERWGFPVAGNKTYTEGDGKSVPYSMGYLNHNQAESTNYWGGISPPYSEDEGLDCQVDYHGETTARSAHSTAAAHYKHGKYGVEDVDNPGTTAGSHAHYSAVTFGAGYPAYGSWGKFGPVHLANKALFLSAGGSNVGESVDFDDANLNISLTVDDDYGVIDGHTPSKINETEFLVDWTDSNDDSVPGSFDPLDMAYVDWKFRLGTPEEIAAHRSAMVDIYARIGSTVITYSIPSNWHTRRDVSSWVLNGWNPGNYIGGTPEVGHQVSNTLFCWLGYINDEGIDKANNIDSTRNGVRTYLVEKYFNL